MLYMEDICLMHITMFLPLTSGVYAENALKPRRNALKESRKHSLSQGKKKTTQHLLRTSLYRGTVFRIPKTRYGRLFGI